MSVFFFLLLLMTTEYLNIYLLYYSRANQQENEPGTENCKISLQKEDETSQRETMMVEEKVKLNVPYRQVQCFVTIQCMC